MGLSSIGYSCEMKATKQGKFIYSCRLPHVVPEGGILWFRNALFDDLCRHDVTICQLNPTSTVSLRISKDKLVVQYTVYDRRPLARGRHDPPAT